MAQISILVSPPVRDKGFKISDVLFPLWGMAKKGIDRSLPDAVIAVIDDGKEGCLEYRLAPSEQQHVIRLLPGHHTLTVYDAKGDVKATLRNAPKAGIAIGVALMGGGLSNTADALSASLDRSNTKRQHDIAENSFVEFDLDHNETIAFKCEITDKGIVNLTLI